MGPFHLLIALAEDRIVQGLITHFASILDFVKAVSNRKNAKIIAEEDDEFPFLTKCGEMIVVVHNYLMIPLKVRVGSLRSGSRRETQRDHRARKYILHPIYRHGVIFTDALTGRRNPQSYPDSV